MSEDEKDDAEENIETTKHIGSVLEKNVEFIFQSAGFETQRNVREAKYEIDVLARIGDRKIVVECKNYQNTKLPVRNLIHQWHSKNEVIKASKVVLVIAGGDVKNSDYQLANKFNIEIWTESDLSDLFELSLQPKKLREKLLQKIDFKPIKISDKYRDSIAQKVIYPILRDEGEDEEDTYDYFNHWLRAFIRTELNITGTTKEERINYIQLFEDTKEKQAFFFLKFKRDPTEYWENLLKNLKNSSLLPKATRNTYLVHMSNLQDEYKDMKDLFSKTDEKTIRKLIYQRLYDSLISKNDICNFGFSKDETIKVISKNEGFFVLFMEDIDDKQANIIDWITTSEHKKHIEESGNRTNENYLWVCTSIEEAAEKTYRILDEFYGYEDDDELRDYAL